MSRPPAHLNAGNAGLFTLDGTRTYLVGGPTRLAVVDPGPELDRHARAVISAARAASEVVVLLTHGHADHAGAADRVAAALDAPVLGPSEAGPDRVLVDGETVSTDEGALRAVHTPGHTRGHLAYWWVERRALFAGDHLLGSGDTTWVAEYPGCVADYLRSLDRVRALEPSVIYPAHGSPLEDPREALDRFEGHRRQRIRQVREALVRDPGLDEDGLLRAVYGRDLPGAVRGAALRSLAALREHVEAEGAGG
jgi:hydroxyacylglutathione hydrolase